MNKQMKPENLKPIDLTNDTKVYQFIKQTESENRTSKLALDFDKKSHTKLLKAIENWMRWHTSKLVESQKSVGKKNKKECTH
jgi:hypothetical protein